jgi:hypothetical protein
MAKEEYFYDRIIEEQKQLEKKLSKLTDFINTEIFARMPLKKSGLLILQENIMKSYLLILQSRLDQEERINIFKIT